MPHAWKNIIVKVLLVFYGTAMFAESLSSQLVEPDIKDIHSRNEVWIESGQYTMGSNFGYINEAPAHKAKVGGFWIDRYEVTNAMFMNFVEATGYVTTSEAMQKVTAKDGTVVQIPPGSLVFRSPEYLKTGHANDWWVFVEGASWREPEGPGSSIRGKSNYPVVHVSHIDARAYADWVARELPTEKEWEFAAKYGNTKNSALKRAQSEPDPQTANTWQGNFPIKNTSSDGFEGLSPVGSFPENGAGLFDMIGNVWELVADKYKPHTISIAALSSQPSSVTYLSEPQHIMKGGSFLCDFNYCFRSRAEARLPIGQYESSSHVGFRTVRR
jgi:formylglycine-generating enzyme required for sulfatase activity